MLLGLLMGDDGFFMLPFIVIFATVVVTIIIVSYAISKADKTHNKIFKDIKKKIDNEISKELGLDKPEVKETIKYCDYCGSVIAQSDSECKNCGAHIHKTK